MNALQLLFFSLYVIYYECNFYEYVPGEIYDMDSLFQGRIGDKMKQQICSITHSSTDFIKLRVLPVQQQTNGVCI